MIPNILIIEDQADKKELILNVLRMDPLLANFEAKWAKSVSTAYSLVTSTPPIDFIILDMAFASQASRNTQASNSLAGKEILDYLSTRGIDVPVVVATSYDDFSDGKKLKFNSTKKLDEYLHARFSKNYLGLVHVQHNNTEWHSKLHELLIGSVKGSS